MKLIDKMVKKIKRQQINDEEIKRRKEKPERRNKPIRITNSQENVEEGYDE